MVGSVAFWLVPTGLLVGESGVGLPEGLRAAAARPADTWVQVCLHREHGVFHQAEWGVALAAIGAFRLAGLVWLVV